MEKNLKGIKELLRKQLKRYNFEEEKTCYKVDWYWGIKYFMLINAFSPPVISNACNVCSIEFISRSRVLVDTSVEILVDLTIPKYIIILMT